MTRGEPRGGPVGEAIHAAVRPFYRDVAGPLTLKISDTPLNDPRPTRRANVAALVAVAVLAALLFWLAQAILAHNRLQNCLDSGRRDCVPIETGSG